MKNGLERAMRSKRVHVRPTNTMETSCKQYIHRMRNQCGRALVWARRKIGAFVCGLLVRYSMSASIAKLNYTTHSFTHFFWNSGVEISVCKKTFSYLSISISVTNIIVVCLLTLVLSSIFSSSFSVQCYEILFFCRFIAFIFILVWWLIFWWRYTFIVWSI